MNRDHIEKLLAEVQRGEMTIEAAVAKLSTLPFVDTGSARIDTHRALRQGIPEVIFGQGKSAGQIAEIAQALIDAGQDVLVTRVEEAVAMRVLERVPGGRYDGLARILCFGPDEVEIVGKGIIAVVCAGTADLPVASEAVLVAQRFGNRVSLLQDVGVAGIHRLLASMDALREARVLIVVAGMEGALPSVVGGMVDKPVIAVPTSVGYGAALGGIAALLGMLTSCASNVTVVNIDNGFGAAHAATLINRL
jgi:NCAIR mutase (PurE)-related protein